MNPDKVRRRIAELSKRGEVSPELLERLARDLGFAMARGQRAALAAAARELAAHAPAPPAAKKKSARAERTAWAAGYASCLGSLLAAFEAAHERGDAHQAALRAASSEVSRAVVRLLAEGPATGAELAAELGVTASSTSKVLAQLRGAGLARVAGGRPYPKRGAPKPHLLTSLGSWVADTLAAAESTEGSAADRALSNAG